MPSIKFKNRAVAFIDILGFKSIVNAAEQSESKLVELEQLIDILENAIPEFDEMVDERIPKELIPKYIYISDSIILSAPLTSSEMPRYRGLTILVMRIIQLSHVLLSKGYLIRGGVSVGSVWHTDSNIIGAAYQDAYQIEAKTLVPRVELSPSAKEYWDKSESNLNTMCREYKNHFMVNTLHDYYIKDESSDAARRAFDKYACVIEGNLKADHPEAVRYKWWWFKEYLESEVKGNPFIRCA